MINTITVKQDDNLIMLNLQLTKKVPSTGLSAIINSKILRMLIARTGNIIYYIIHIWRETETIFRINAFMTNVN